MIKDITVDAMETLEQYDWPGNVREMENVIERLVVSTFTDTITRQHVENILLPGAAAIRQTGKTSNEDTGDMLSLGEQVNAFEKEILIMAKKKYKTSRAMAEYLKVDQSTIVKKMKKYQINESMTE